jgi:1,4-dihydroxy-2-naphthoyl-CoA synthase
MRTALSKISGGIADLILKRLEVRNAFSPEKFNELRQAIDAVGGEEKVCCVIPVLLASVQVVGEIACCV